MIARDIGRKRNGHPSREVTLAARARKRRWLAMHRDPIKESARRIVRSAIERGEIIPRETCEDCNDTARRRDGARAIQAHHYLGYENPMAIMWLCPKCHRKHDHDAAASASDGRARG